MDKNKKELKYFLSFLALVLITILTFNFIGSYFRNKQYTSHYNSLNSLYLTDSSVNSSLTSKLTKEDFIKILKRVSKQEIMFRDLNFKERICSGNYFVDVNSEDFKGDLDSCKMIEYLAENKLINYKEKDGTKLEFEKDDKMSRFEVYKFLTVLFLKQYPGDFQLYDGFTGYLDLSKEKEPYIYTLEKYKISERKYNNFYPNEKIEVGEFYKILNNFVAKSTIDINVLNNYTKKD